MPTLSFKIKYGKNNGLVLSPAELLERHFFGISICTSNGEALAQETIRRKILSAQSAMENYLGVKFQKQLLVENKDFIRGEWMGWGFLRMTYLIRDIVRLEGFINTVKQIEYPSSWVSVNRPSDEKLLLRHVHLVPSGTTETAVTQSVVYAGITPHLGFFGMSEIPNYWTVKYCTGFDTTPPEIVEAIEKLAAQQLFAILGDIILGAGIANQSLSFDGLSQSIGTTQSAENSSFSARIRQYETELKRELPALKEYYGGIKYTAL